MSGFGIVYALDISPTQLLLSKILCKFTAIDKITKLSTYENTSFAFPHSRSCPSSLKILCKFTARDKITKLSTYRNISLAFPHSRSCPSSLNLVVYGVHP